MDFIKLVFAELYDTVLFPVFMFGVGGLIVGVVSLILTWSFISCACISIAAVFMLVPVGFAVSSVIMDKSIGVKVYRSR